MHTQPETITILMVDDDSEDGLLVEKAIAQAGHKVDFRSVQSGMELLDYLFMEGAFTDRSAAPRPHLILLDLNMPGLDGHTVLKRIKQDENLRRIPVVVLSTSEAAADIVQSYDSGANSFITKPAGFSEMVEVMKSLNNFWFETARLPAA